MGRYFVIGGKSGNQEGAIRYDQPQELTDAQKKQAQENIGIDSSAGMKRIIVDTLPETDIDTNAIYMVSRAEAEEQNVYDEYMYIENAWEKIGSTDVDLSDYYTKEEADEKFEDYYTKTEVDGKLEAKANSADVYTKGEVYTKTEVYNKSEIDTKLVGINNILETI